VPDGTLSSQSGKHPITRAALLQIGGPSFVRAPVLDAPPMFYFLVKAGLSGLLAAAISEIARRYPGWGGLVASLPLTSLMAMLWLWRDTGDPTRIGDLSISIIWFIAASLPLFIALPLLLRAGAGFWVSMVLSVALALGAYALMFWVGPKFGLKL
jgi:hypothetical protein